MPSLQTIATTTVSTTREVTLKPSVRRKLLTELKLYQELKAQKQVLEAALEQHKVVIGRLRDETGEQSVKIDGFTVTLVAGTRNVLNKLKFVQLGGSLTMLEEATETKPSKPYEKITLPGEKVYGDDI